MPPLDPERMFVENLDLVDEVVHFICVRQRLNRHEAEELAAGVRLKLIEDDYAVLQKFVGRSSLRTYLTTVVQRYFLDRRNEQWGKWRPAAEARRAGPVGVLLDRLLTRDRLPFDQAVEIMRTNHGVAESVGQLEAIRAKLPERHSRRMVGEEQLDAFTVNAAGEDTLIRQLDAAARGETLKCALSEALDSCEATDRFLLKLRFQDGLQVSQIARLMRVDQRALYRRLEHLMIKLRRELEARGVDRTYVDDMLADAAGKQPFTSVSVAGESPVPSGRRDNA